MLCHAHATPCLPSCLLFILTLAPAYDTLHPPVTPRRPAFHLAGAADDSISFLDPYPPSPCISSHPSTPIPPPADDNDDDDEDNDYSYHSPSRLCIHPCIVPSSPGIGTTPHHFLLSSTYSSLLSCMYCNSRSNLHPATFNIQRSNKLPRLQSFTLESRYRRRRGYAVHDVFPGLPRHCVDLRTRTVHGSDQYDDVVWLYTYVCMLCTPSGGSACIPEICDRSYRISCAQPTHTGGNASQRTKYAHASTREVSVGVGMYSANKKLSIWIVQSEESARWRVNSDNEEERSRPCPSVNPVVRPGELCAALSERRAPWRSQEGGEYEVVPVSSNPDDPKEEMRAKSKVYGVAIHRWARWVGW
ncbi:hypothetical protein C8Q73DRAFT_150364 [Cubamyces lactineus]|nr:hypothetical protein C8Q73DRAFT_150364 [Cubamyces lactineus]